MLKKLLNVIVWLLKICFYLSLYAVFYILFAKFDPWLTRLNRTSVVTTCTFVLFGLAMTKAYGGYAIGVHKSKPIIYSMILATAITDFCAHLMLCIMSTNDMSGRKFVYQHPLVLLLVFVIQIALIYFFVYLGNYIYFSIRRPEKCCVIVQRIDDADDLMVRLKKYKKQYRIRNLVEYRDPDVYDYIDAADSVFFYNISLGHRSRLVEYCYQKNKNIYYNLEISDIVALGAKVVSIDDKVMMMDPVKDLTFEQSFFKRLVDIVISLVALIVASPIMLVCAIAIKLDDGGHVFYRQKRATKNGRIFYMIKFRSMKEEGSCNKSVTKDDDRITRVGKWIRKFRVDELPQFINILLGDMSVVGPRPEMVENVEKYTAELPEFEYRLRVKAGLTGLAQIEGKYNTSPSDKLVMDLMYIENYSLLEDIKLILKTPTVIFKSEESTEAFSNDKENK